MKDSNRLSGLKNILRAFEYRNYRLYFGGQSVSLLGMWMQQLAMSWLVYRLTGSALLLGVVGFCGQIPIFLISPFAGVMADRWNRHKMLIITQVFSMIQALILAFLVMTGRIEVWTIIALSFFIGVVNAFDAPARQSFLVQMIEDKAVLGNAIALNSSLFNGARLVGPSIAGIIISAVGEGICFLLNGISYIGVIIALLVMKITPRKIEESSSNIFKDLKEGFDYAFSFPPIKSIIILVAFISLAGMPYAVLMPVFAKEILRGGPETLGFLMGASGIGAFSGAVYLASRKHIGGLTKMIPLSSALFGAGLIAFSFSKSLYLSMFILIFTGFGFIATLASCNTVLQTIVDDDKRGRVMSLYTMAFLGLAPFGSLLAGYIANYIGAPNTITIGGAICIIGSCVFAAKIGEIREILRPIYEQAGLIPGKPPINQPIAEFAVFED